MCKFTQTNISLRRFNNYAFSGVSTTLLPQAFQDIGAVYERGKAIEARGGFLHRLQDRTHTEWGVAEQSSLIFRSFTLLPNERIHAGGGE